MSDIDRVFARMGGGGTTGGEQRELRRIPRRGAVGGTRVVEVVRLASRRAFAFTEPPSPQDDDLHTASLDENFTALAHAPVVPPAAEATSKPEPVFHVMPAWTPRAVEVQTVAPAPEAETEPAVRGRPRRTRPATASPPRRVADPFNASDDGANCIRCGYAVEPAREQRGLMTCAGCG